MIIVLEGPDGGGKTTLATELAIRLQLEYMRSEGPAKAPGEIDERIRNYNRRCGHLIFDRHPCISQLAYRIVHDQPTPDPQLIEEFYALKPVIIYCRPPHKHNHQASGEWDTPEFLDAIDKNFDKLLDWYDRWAVQHASYIYRIGDDVSTLTQGLYKGRYHD